jgi:hypothetical protein
VSCLRSCRAANAVSARLLLGVCARACVCEAAARRANGNAPVCALREVNSGLLVLPLDDLAVADFAKANTKACRLKRRAPPATCTTRDHDGWCRKVSSRRPPADVADDRSWSDWSSTVNREGHAGFRMVRNARLRDHVEITFRLGSRDDVETGGAQLARSTVRVRQSSTGARVAVALDGDGVAVVAERIVGVAAREPAGLVRRRAGTDQQARHHCLNFSHPSTISESAWRLDVGRETHLFEVRVLAEHSLSHTEPPPSCSVQSRVQTSAAPVVGANKENAPM